MAFWVKMAYTLITAVAVLAVAGTVVGAKFEVRAASVSSTNNF
jgi:hypothetical protein